MDLHQQIATGSCPQHFIDTGFHVQLRRQHARRAVTRGQGEALGDMLGGFGPAQLVPVVCGSKAGSVPILPRSWHRAIQTHRGSPATASITSIRWAITEPEWYATGPAGISIEVSSSRNHGERQFPSASTDS